MLKIILKAIFNDKLGFKLNLSLLFKLKDYDNNASKLLCLSHFVDKSRGFTEF